MMDNEQVEKRLKADRYIIDKKTHLYVNFNEDGCPNNCGYCEHIQQACVYRSMIND